MTVSLSSSFMPRPSASVISALRAAALRSTGGGFWEVRERERAEFPGPEQNLIHTWPWCLGLQLPCFESSPSRTLPPAWRWPSCSWLLWRCRRTDADCRMGSFHEIHKSERGVRQPHWKNKDCSCVECSFLIQVHNSMTRSPAVTHSTCSPALKATSSSLTADSPSCSPRGDIIWAPAAATSCSTATTQVRCFLQSDRVSETYRERRCQKVKRENGHLSPRLEDSPFTCCPKFRAAGIPGASVPGILRRIFLQNCLTSLQDVSRSLSSTARSTFSWPACKNALRRPTSTAIQSKALWVNWACPGRREWSLSDYYNWFNVTVLTLTLMWSASCMVQSSLCSDRWMLYRCCREPVI